MIMLEFGLSPHEIRNPLKATGSRMTRLRFIVLGLIVLLPGLGLFQVAQAQAAGPTIHIHAVDRCRSIAPVRTAVVRR